MGYLHEFQEKYGVKYNSSELKIQKNDHKYIKLP